VVGLSRWLKRRGCRGEAYVLDKTEEDDGLEGDELA
jgi:hypothetical protein